MGRPKVLHDPTHTMLLGHDLHGRGPRGCLDLTQVRTHPPDPTAALVPRNDHPTPTIPTKNPTLKHKPPQPVQLRSKAQVPRVLSDLGLEPVTVRTLFRSLGRCGQRGYRESISGALFEHVTNTGGGLALCLYDVTTLYFEAEREDDLRRVGYSKERRVDPQVIVGLLVDRRGFPLT